jgi:hypothetical protein
LHDCPAGATVNVGVHATMNAVADSFEIDDNEVCIRSDKDVEVGMANGQTEWLSTLSDNESE